MENQKQTLACVQDEAYESNTNLLELPNDCLLHILNYISLRDVLICRQVCHQWLVVVLQFGKSIHTLRLFHNFFSKPDCETYFKLLHDSNLQDDPEFAFNRFNSLVLKPLVTEFGHNAAAMHLHRKSTGKLDYGGRFLPQLFPNVHNLMVSFMFKHGNWYNTQLHMDHVFLFQQWRASLHSLTVFGQPRYGIEWYGYRTEHRKSVYDALNKCTNLKRIHLINFEKECDNFDLEECPALHNKLETYSFSNFSDFDLIQESQLTAVKCLRGSAACISESIPNLLQNVCQVSLNGKDIKMEYILGCCLNFTNLAYLDISSLLFLSKKHTDYDLRDLTKRLAKMPKLVHLKLSAYLILTDLNCRTQEELCKIPKLRSIRTLHLVDNQTVLLNHFKPLHYEFLSDKFPSVSTIHISCLVNLHRAKFKAKMIENFVKHFGAKRLSEIKFFKFTRLQDVIKRDKMYI